MFVVLTFLMIKIVPEFEVIFEEFQVDLPPMTQLAVALSAFVVNYLAIPLFWAFVLAIFSAMAVGICYLCGVSVFKRVSDRVFHGRSSADVLRILAIATEHRQPLSEVLQRVSTVYPSAVIRRQLRGAARTIGEGTDWRAALAAANVITMAELALLKTAEKVGNLPWALRAIAKRREKRAVYRLATMLQVLYPLAILVLGAFVGFYVVSLFMPIVKLIQGLS
jgi:type II secretory pathway component PulF